MRNEAHQSSRRRFLHRLTALGTAGIVAPGMLAACGGDSGTDPMDAPSGNPIGSTPDTLEGTRTADAGFACTDMTGLTEEQIQLRTNSNYVDKSPHEDKRCSNCQLFMVPAEGEQCGTCQILPGPIHPDGYCDLWVTQQV